MNEETQKRIDNLERELEALKASLKEPELPEKTAGTVWKTAYGVVGVKQPQVRVYNGESAESFGLHSDSFVLWLVNDGTWASCHFKSLEHGDHWLDQRDLPKPQEGGK